MKRRFLIVNLIGVLLTTALTTPFTGVLLAQEKSESQKVKKGWNFGPLPAVSYNSDLGFQYGALCDIFYFGDGSTYPNYLHKFNLELSRYTKGTGVYHFFYDSHYLIPSLRVTADITYLTDRMMDFFGYNGYQSPYIRELEDPFYKIDRNLFRATVDLQGKIADNFSWVGGVGLYRYAIGDVKLEQYQNLPSLYKQYQLSGLIKQSEKSGGDVAEFKVGALYDSRDNEADPYRGYKAELITLHALTSNKGASYGKALLSLSAYLPLWQERLTFAAKASWQGTIYGSQPFYTLQNITTLYYRQITSEGLGGINTVRGIMRNRIVGDGLFWSNLELRYRFAPFSLIGQEWYLVLNPFFDAGRVVKYYREGLMSNLVDEQFHLSAGLGFKVVMNRNFIVSAEWGKPFDKRDGDSGLNIGLNFIF